MNSSKAIRWGGTAAMLGGALNIARFGVTALIYGVFAEETKGYLLSGARLHSLG